MQLVEFNQASEADVKTFLKHCVQIESWANELLSQRPYASLDSILEYAAQAARTWSWEEIKSALDNHPRIGEKPTGQQAHAALSRQEQSAINDNDAQLVGALRAGNARYEARFGRVFLIRAKGRSPEAILQALEQRLTNSDAEEAAEALVQLREITLLRLAGVIGE